MGLDFGSSVHGWVHGGGDDMGNPWFEVNLPKQAEHEKALGEINWRVSQDWQGIAGKVSPRVVKRKVDGKTVREEIPDEYTLAAGRQGARRCGRPGAHEPH